MSNRFRNLLILASVLCVALAAGLLWLLQPTTDELFEQGVAAIDSGDILAAEDAIQRLLQRRGSLEYVRVLEGGLQIASGRNEQGLTQLDPSQATGAVRRPALVWAGQGLVNLGLIGQAEQVLRIAVQEFPDDEPAVRLLAIVYYDLGAMYPALDTLVRLQKLAPQDYRPFHLAGVIHLDFEQYAEAVDDFTEALNRETPEALAQQIRFDLARAQMNLRQYEDALQTLSRTGNVPEHHGLAAQCHLGLGQADQAAAELGRLPAQSEAPDPQAAPSADSATHPEVLRARSKLLQEAGQLEACLVVLQELVQAEPHNIAAHHQIAQVLGRMGRTDDQQAAIEQAEQIRKLRRRLTELSTRANASPTDCEVKAEIAAVCEELGRADLSRVWQQAAQACRRAHPTLKADADSNGLDSDQRP